ncbi:MAG: ThiF family adenylyltransferase [Deltaproteobacteria bacterium]|nr:ThiF family adenylyltransferase [Deltaproteobacteria bacterium]
MALPRFFDRVFAAAGRSLSIERIDLERILEGRTIALFCGEECNEEGNARWMAELLINMLARLYPQISISATSSSVEDHLTTIAKDINPLLDLSQGQGKIQISVVIGTHSDFPESAIFPWAGGWVVRLSNEPLPSPGLQNPYAAGAAAAFAAAEVFRRSFYEFLPEKAAKPFKDFQLSLIDFGESNGETLSLKSGSVGELAFFGLGAIGNPAIWALARHRALSGKLWLIDDEDVELSNLQRYALAKDKDVEMAKTELAGRELYGSDLEYKLFKGKLEDFGDSLSGEFHVPTICVAVDNVEGRRISQALLPRLVLNGWTGDGCLGVSWHEFYRDAACLGCLYPPEPGKSQTELVAEALGLQPFRAAELWVRAEVPSEEEFQTIAGHLGVKMEEIKEWRNQPITEIYRGLICSSTRLDLKGIKKRAVVPLSHQSVLTGILLASELVKRTDPELSKLSQEDGFIIWEDVLSPPGRSWTRVRKRVPGCICGDKIYQEVYAKKWLPAKR